MNKFNTFYGKILKEIRTIEDVISARETNKKIFKYTSNDVIKELILAKKYANELTNKDDFVDIINQIMKDIANGNNTVTVGEFYGIDLGRVIFLLKEKVRELYDSGENEDTVMQLETTLQDAYRKQMKRKI